MSKRRIVIIGVLILVFVILSAIFLYPMRLDEYLSKDEDIRIVYTQAQINDGATGFDTTTHSYEAGSKEFDQIIQLLSEHTYHRSIRTISNSSSMEGTAAGYWIHIYSGDNTIIMGGTGEVSINSKIYKIGYLGNKKNLSLMEKIKSILLIKEK